MYVCRYVRICPWGDHLQLEKKNNVDNLFPVVTRAQCIIAYKGRCWRVTLYTQMAFDAHVYRAYNIYKTDRNGRKYFGYIVKKTKNKVETSEKGYEALVRQINCRFFCRIDPGRSHSSPSFILTKLPPPLSPSIFVYDTQARMRSFIYVRPAGGKRSN